MPDQVLRLVFLRQWLHRISPSPSSIQFRTADERSHSLDSVQWLGEILSRLPPDSMQNLNSTSRARRGFPPASHPVRSPAELPPSLSAYSPSASRRCNSDIEHSFQPNLNRHARSSGLFQLPD